VTVERRAQARVDKRCGLWDYLDMENNTHICGGTILVGGSGEQEHQYCDSCAAYTYDLSGDVPSGIDAEANRAAWDAGDIESPYRSRLMTAAQISEHVARQGVSLRAFWREAAGGDMMSMPRADVDAVLATMVEG